MLEIVIGTVMFSWHLKKNRIYPICGNWVYVAVTVLYDIRCEKGLGFQAATSL